MVLTLAAPTFFMPKLAWTNKSTCYGGTNLSNGLHSAPAAPKVHAKGLPKSNVISASWKEEHNMNLEARKLDGVYDMFGGRLVQGGLVFQQNFSIRSYDLGPDGKATIGSLMKRLQETSIRHCTSAGLSVSGFGSTPEMSKRGLVWVLRKLQIVVENYPSWDDVIQIDTWTSTASRDNGFFRDCIFRDYKTGQILLQATSLYVMMNMKSRRLSKIIAEIRDELKPVLGDSISEPLIDINSTKLRQLNIDDARNYVRAGLAPGWSDLDFNQHVSNVKYIDWVFESIPISILESHQLSSMTLEFRRECRRDSVLQSWTAASKDGISGNSRHDDEEVEFDHLLRLQTGSQILRGKTIWKAKAHLLPTLDVWSAETDQSMV